MRHFYDVTRTVSLLLALCLSSAFIPCAAAISEIGSTIEFGGIEWRVLDADGDKVLVLSEHILHGSYTSARWGRGWEESTFRQYLNGSFFDETFSEDEKSKIIETSVKNDTWSYYGTTIRGNTTDKIFLLSQEEAVKYLGNGKRCCDTEFCCFGNTDNEYNSMRVASDETGRPAWWWLRTPGLYVSSASVVVLEDGIIHRDGHSTTMLTGLRPAMRIIGTPPVRSNTYTIVKGDTLWGIARRYLGSGTRWSEIYALNRDKIADPNLIYPGQELVLP
jgi:hypothetical protein